MVGVIDNVVGQSLHVVIVGEFIVSHSVVDPQSLSGFSIGGAVLTLRINTCTM